MWGQTGAHVPLGVVSGSRWLCIREGAAEGYNEVSVWGRTMSALCRQNEHKLDSHCFGNLGDKQLGVAASHRAGCKHSGPVGEA